jgi:hypothetical protein
MNPNPLPEELGREDLLIHRAIDGSAGVGDWAELELLARRDPEVWRRLALAMRGELVLRRAGAAIEERLPALPLGAVPPSGHRAALLVGSLGWAAALLIGLLWAGAFELGLAPAPVEPRSASAPADSDAAWASYLEQGIAEGRVLRELAPLMIEARPSADGASLDVLYLRRAVERATVDEVHEVCEDDAGRLTSYPVPVQRLVSSEPL